MEELVKLDPDVVFYHSESDAEPIRQAGIPAVALTHPNKGGSASRSKRSAPGWTPMPRRSG